MRIAVTLLMTSIFFSEQTFASEAIGPSEIFGSEEFVSIAVGHEQSVQVAPAVVSIFTAEDIKNSGARDINDVLNMVPGMHVALNYFGWVPDYTPRGVNTVLNRSILFMVDGIPETNFPTASSVLDKIPLDIIERVEVSLGPSSSLYGADAFAGVVNIITKNEVPKENELTLSGGSYNTKDGRAVFGQKIGDYNLVGALEYFKTDGHKSPINADLQTFLDSIMGTNASLAPGYANTQKNDTAFHLNLSGKNFTWTTRFSELSNYGVGTGNSGSLDPYGSKDQQLIETNLKLQIHLSEKSEFGSKFMYRHLTQRQENLHLLPPGAFFIFPEGIILDNETHATIGYGEINLTYYGFTDHRFIAGIGGRYKEIKVEKERRNYFVTSSGFPVPFGGMVDTTADSIYGSKSIYRNLLFFYFQDEWALLPDWTLTFGTRVDRFTNFCTTINPRAALVWAARHNLTAKLLYGRGFREPTFIETDLQQTPQHGTNPDLAPETINSMDFVLDYNLNEDVRLTTSFFYHQTDNRIRFINTGLSTPVNGTSHDGHGFELAAWWNITSDTKFYSYYSMQKNTKESLGQITGFAPHHKFFAMLQHKYKSLFFSPRITYLIDRERILNDPRPQIGDDIQVDLLARWEMTPFSELSVDIRNLFNSDIENPTSGMAVAHDIKLPGRNYYFSLTLKF